MANYVAKTVTENPGYMQADVIVPADTKLHAGQVVVAETLDSTLGYGNWKTYTAEQVSDITSDSIAIILNGTFETLDDGRRPKGQPDYTQYEYQAGEIATAHRLLPETRYEISVDSCDETVANALTAGTLVPGDNLIPANGSYELAYSAAATAVTAKNYLRIEAIKYFRLGGQFGMDFAANLIVRAKHTDATA